MLACLRWPILPSLWCGSLDKVSFPSFLAPWGWALIILLLQWSYMMYDSLLAVNGLVLTRPKVRSLAVRARRSYFIRGLRPPRCHYWTGKFSCVLHAMAVDYLAGFWTCHTKFDDPLAGLIPESPPKVTAPPAEGPVASCATLKPGSI